MDPSWVKSTTRHIDHVVGKLLPGFAPKEALKNRENISPSHGDSPVVVTFPLGTCQKYPKIIFSKSKMWLGNCYMEAPWLWI